MPSACAGAEEPDYWAAVQSPVGWKDEDFL
jgi:hypothetical protein